MGSLEDTLTAKWRDKIYRNLPGGSVENCETSVRDSLDGQAVCRRSWELRMTLATDIGDDLLVKVAPPIGVGWKRSEITLDPSGDKPFPLSFGLSLVDVEVYHPCPAPR